MALHVYSASYSGRPPGIPHFYQYFRQRLTPSGWKVMMIQWSPGHANDSLLSMFRFPCDQNDWFTNILKIPSFQSAPQHHISRMVLSH